MTSTKTGRPDARPFDQDQLWFVLDVPIDVQGEKFEVTQSLTGSDRLASEPLLIQAGPAPTLADPILLPPCPGSEWIAVAGLSSGANLTVQINGEEYERRPGRRRRYYCRPSNTSGASRRNDSREAVSLRPERLCHLRRLETSPDWQSRSGGSSLPVCLHRARRVGNPGRACRDTCQGTRGRLCRSTDHQPHGRGKRTGHALGGRGPERDG